MSKQMILDLPDNLYEHVQQAEREDVINVLHWSFAYPRLVIDPVIIIQSI